jgi:hypothetical protein
MAVPALSSAPLKRMVDRRTRYKAALAERLRRLACLTAANCLPTRSRSERADDHQGVRRLRAAFAFSPACRNREFEGADVREYPYGPQYNTGVTCRLAKEDTSRPLDLWAGGG